jgi:hypothetical protein
MMNRPMARQACWVLPSQWSRIGGPAWAPTAGREGSNTANAGSSSIDFLALRSPETFLRAAPARRRDNGPEPKNVEDYPCDTRMPILLNF